MQIGKTSIKFFVSKYKKILIATILSILLVVTGAISLTLALFNAKEDFTIDVNFHNEAVLIDAEIDPNKSLVSSDVTLLKLFQPSNEVPNVNLINGAQVTILPSDFNALKVRFRIGFEYHGNTTISSNSLKLIQSYLNNSTNFASVVASMPNYSWVYNSNSGYFELYNSSNSTQALLDTTTQSYTLNVINGVVDYSGYNELSLSIPNEDKEILEKLCLNLQIEVCQNGTDFEAVAPTYTYGKVAIFNALDGEPVSARFTSGTTLTLPVATKPYHNFDGWYDSNIFATLVGPAGGTTTQTAGVETYYAKFSPETYTVTLNPNGGRLILNNNSSELYQIPNIAYNTPFISTSALTVADARNFLGYYDELDVCYIDSNGTAIRDWDKTSDGTLTAKFSAPRLYDIVYSGIENAYFNQNTIYQYLALSTVATIPRPIKDGYTFSGWNVVNGANHTNNILDYHITTATTGAIYMHANFTVNPYNATFPSGVLPSGTNLAYNIESGLTMPSLSEQYAGFQVASTSSQAGTSNWKVGEIYPSDTQISNRYGNVTFELVEAIQAIRLDVNPSNGGASVIPALSEGASVDPIFLGTGLTGTIHLPDATCPGYKFLGWYDRPNVNDPSAVLIARNFTFSASNNLPDILYAKWVAGTPSYAVTLNNDGGTGGATSTTFTQKTGNKEEFALPASVAIPSKAGYTFAGYYSEPSGQGVKFFNALGQPQVTDFSSAYVDDYSYSYTLYAAYIENVYTITFDSAGGADVPNIPYTINTISVSAPKTAKFGYTFTGWKPQPVSGTNTGWTNASINGEEIATQNKSGNITLVAQYSVINYTITINYYETLNSTGYATPNTPVTYSVETASLNLSYSTQTGTESLTGHEFKGWRVAVGLGSWSVGSLITPENAESFTLLSSHYGNVVLVAEYTINTYTITFTYLDSAGNPITNDREYLDASKPIYFTYKNTSVVLREQVNKLGKVTSQWKPRVTTGGWSATDNYNSGATINNLSLNQYCNVELVSTITKLFERGDGSPSNPFIISSAVQLTNLSSVIENSATYPLYSSLDYALGWQGVNPPQPGDPVGTFAGGNALDNSTGFYVPGTDFESIGSWGQPFRGTFDGRNFEIRGLRTVTANDSEQNNSGLFGCVNGGRIVNVKLFAPKITSTASCSAALVSAASNGTLIENCHTIAGTINSVESGADFAQTYSGMIVGVATGRVIIKNCSNSVPLIFRNIDCGGIVGNVKKGSILLDLTNFGRIEIRDSADTSIGGIAGFYGGNMDKHSRASCFALNLYNHGEIKCYNSIVTEKVGGLIGYKGGYSYAFNLYSDGEIRDASNNLKTARAIGTEIIAGSPSMENREYYANGVLNRYFKDGSVHANTTNSITGYRVTATQIVGNVTQSTSQTPKDNIITTNYILGTNTFASLATLFNVWLYDLQRQGSGTAGLVPPVHYTYVNADSDVNGLKDGNENKSQNDTMIQYDSLYEYMSALSINHEQLHYWKTNGVAQTAELVEQDVSECSLALTYVDLCGGMLNGTYSRIYGKITQGGVLLYADEEYIEAADFFRPGYTFKGLYENPQGDGEPVSRYIADTDYYLVSAGNHASGLVTYYAVWEKIFSEGSGTANDPFIITSGAQLKALADVVNTGAVADASTGLLYRKAIYHQPIPIHLEGVTGFAPIGTNQYPFEGTYYGYNNNIYADTLYSNNLTDYVGLFGYVQNATLSSIRITFHKTLLGRDHVGGVVGYALNSRLTNLYSSSPVQGNNKVGVLVGTLCGSSLVNSVARGAIIGNIIVGGIVGEAVNNGEQKAIIENNFGTGNNVLRGNTADSIVGGIAGKITNTKVLNNFVNEKMKLIVTSVTKAGAFFGEVSGSENVVKYNICKSEDLTQVFDSADKQIQNKTLNLTGAGTAPSTTFNWKWSGSSPYHLVDDAEFTLINSSKIICSSLYMAVNAYVDLITKGLLQDELTANERQTFSPYLSVSRDNDYTFLPGTYTSYSRQVTFVTNSKDNWSPRPYQYNTVANATDISIPANPTNAEMEFMGWYLLDSNGEMTTQVISDAGVWIIESYKKIQADNICFYAKWQENADLNVEERTDLVYNGTPQSLISVSLTNDTTYFAIGSTALTQTNCTQIGSLDIPTATNAGSYTVQYIKLITNNNVTTVGTVGFVTVTISPKQLNSTGFIAQSSADVTYTGSAITPPVTLRDVARNENLVQGTDYSITYEDNQNVGQASITLSGENNYSGSLVLHFAIVKAANGSNVVAVANLTFNNTARNLVTATTGTGSTIYYSVGSALNANNYLTGSTSIPKGTNAGSYLVHYYATGDNNHVSKAGSVPVTIARRSISGVTIAGLASMVYTGSQITQGNYTVTDTGLSNLVLASGVHFNVVWGENEKAGASAGSLTINGIGNYTGSKTATFTITKKANTIVVSAITNLVFNNTNQKLVTISGVVENKCECYLKIGTILTSENYSSTGTKYLTGNVDGTTPKGLSAGEYTVYFYSDGGNNYTPISGHTNVVIAQRNLNASYISVTGLTAKDYTGSAIVPNDFAVTDTGLNNLVLKATNATSSTSFAISGENNVDIGTATLKLVGQGNYIGTKTLTFQITASAITASVSVANPTYTGSAQTPQVTKSATGAGITLQNQNILRWYFKLTSGGSYGGLNIVPTVLNGGTYTLYWKVEADNHTPKEGSTTFEVLQAVNVVTIVKHQNNEIIYNAQAQTLYASATASTQLYFRVGGTTSLNESNYQTLGSTAIPKGTNVGSYVVYYYAPANANYTASAGNQSFTVSITPRSITNVTCSIPNQNYTGSPITPAVTIKDSVPTTNSTVASSNYTLSWSDNVNAGTQAKLIITGRANYAEVKEIYFTILHVASALNITWPTNLTFNHSEQNLYSVPNRGEGSLFFSLNALNAENCASGFQYPNRIITGTEAGDYMVYYYMTGDGGHQPISGSHQVTIAKRNINAVSVTGLTSKPYTGSAITQPNFVVTDLGITLKTANATSSTHFDIAWNNNVNAGTAILTLTGQGNYTGTKNITFTISKIANNLVVTGRTGLIYNRTEQTLVTKTGGFGECRYSLTGQLTSAGTGSTNIPKRTNAGTYIVYYYCAGDNNHNPVSGSVTVTIAQKNIATCTITPFANSSMVYTGSQLFQGYSVQDGINPLALNTDYTAGWINNINVGTATLEVTGIGNYTGTKTATFTITSATITGVSVSVANLTYTGSAQAPQVTKNATTKGGQTARWYFKLTSGGSYGGLNVVPTVTNVGAYTLYWKVEADNHSAVTGSTNFSVSNATITGVNVSVPSLMWNGSAQAPQVTKNATTKGGQTARWYFKSPDGAYGSQNIVPEYNSPGSDGLIPGNEYILYYKVEANYHNTIEGQVTFSVLNANITNVNVQQNLSNGYPIIGETGPMPLYLSATTVKNKPVTWTFSLTQNGTYTTTIPTLTTNQSTLYCKVNAQYHNQSTVTRTVYASYRFAAPTNLSWNASVLSWTIQPTTSASCAGFTVKLFNAKNNTQYGDTIIVAYTANQTNFSHNFSGFVSQAGTWYAQVKQLAQPNQSIYANSLSAQSPNTTTHEIKFESDSMTSPDIYYRGAFYGETITRPTVSHSICTFLGWGESIGADLRQAAGSMLMVTEDRTEYAVWQIVVTFSIGGESSMRFSPNRIESLNSVSEWQNYPVLNYSETIVVGQTFSLIFVDVNDKIRDSILRSVHGTVHDSGLDWRGGRMLYDVVLAQINALYFQVSMAYDLTSIPYFRI